MVLKKPDLKIGDIVLLIVSLFISSWYIMPAVKVIVPSFFIALLGVIFLVATTLDSVERLTSTVILFAAFCMIFSLYYLFTFEGSMAKSSGIVTQMIVSLTPALVFYQMSKKEQIRKIFFVLVSVMFAYVLITTLIEFTVNPGVARTLAHAEVDDVSTDSIRMRNIGGFGHAYGMVFLIMAFSFLCIQSSRAISKLLFIALIAICVWYVYLSEYFLALVLSLLGVVFIFLLSIRKAAVRYLLIAAFLLVLVFSSDILYNLSTITEGSVSEKFTEVAQSLDLGYSEGTSLTARENVYTMSLSAFTQSPLWGVRGSSVMYAYIGGHSTILDFLGQTGLIGFTSYCLFLWFIYRTIHDRSKEFALIGIFYIALSIVNPTMSFYELSAFVFLYVPLLLTCIHRSQEERE